MTDIHRLPAWQIVERLLWLLSAAVLGVLLWYSYLGFSLPPDLGFASAGETILFESVPCLFWIVGTLILLLIRPRSERWLVLILFNYVAALYLQIGGTAAPNSLSEVVERALLGLFVPIYIHLHLLIPTPWFDRQRRVFLPWLYAVVGFSTILEVAQALPSSLDVLSALIAFTTSLGLIFARLFSKNTSPSTRLAARLMLAGIGLGMGPGMIEWVVHVVPILKDVYISGPVYYIVYLAIPLLPLFYTYAIYKHNLGALEFRANRLLGAYSFMVLYAILVTVVYSIINSWSISTETSTLILVITVIVFVLAAPPLRARFQHWVDRLAYGARYNPEDITDLFARQIPTAIQTEALVRLLTEEILPSLLVRQSALYHLSEDDCELVYVRGVELGTATPQAHHQLKGLLGEASCYRPEPVPASNLPASAFAWVRLVIPLEVQGKEIGVWLLGRRDPDDYYPQNDILLLRSMANILAVVIENAYLFDALQELSLERLRAQQEERQDLAARLHDEPLQRAWAVVSKLDYVLANSSILGEQTTVILQQQKDEVLKLIEQLRSICMGLRSFLLNEDVESMLRETVQTFQERLAGVTVVLKLPKAKKHRPELSDVVMDAVYHVVIEALANVGKHAQATRVQVDLQYDADSLIVRVEDDGQGVAAGRMSLPELIRERHFGLVGLHQWAKMAGGELTIGPAVPQGTVVTLTISGGLTCDPRAEPQ